MGLHRRLVHGHLHLEIVRFYFHAILSHCNKFCKFGLNIVCQVLYS